MPWQDGTLTAEDVASYLGATVDQRMTDCTDAVRAHVQDLWSSVDPLEVWSHPGRHLGARMYAGMRWRSKAAPVGFGSYEAQDGSDYTEWLEATRLIGGQPVIA